MTTTDRLIALLRERHDAGIEKYGVTVDRKYLTPDEWAQHAIEEMLDGAAYLMRLKDEIAWLRDRIKRLEEAGDTLSWYATTRARGEWVKAKEAKP